jgi:hypothetical protein
VLTAGSIGSLICPRSNWGRLDMDPFGVVAIGTAPIRLWWVGQRPGINGASPSHVYRGNAENLFTCDGPLGPFIHPKWVIARLVVTGL